MHVLTTPQPPACCPLHTHTVVGNMEVLTSQVEGGTEPRLSQPSHAYSLNSWPGPPFQAATHVWVNAQPAEDWCQAEPGLGALRLPWAMEAMGRSCLS